MNYREYISSDFSNLMRLGQVAYSQYSNDLTEGNWQEMDAFLKDEMALQNLVDTCHVFVSEEGDELTGMIFLAPSGHSSRQFDTEWSHIRYLAVHPNFRSQGIGRKLTQLCIEYASSNGERHIALHTSEFMDNARSLYESMGFVQGKQFQLYGKRYWIYLKSLLSKPTIEVKEMTINEIPLMVDYFLNSDREFLHKMGADIEKLPSRPTWIKMTEDELRKDVQLKKMFYLIWFMDNTPVGHTNINKIEYGQAAYMHLHLWNKPKRKHGIGTEFVKQSLPIFFERFTLKTLFCETHAQNLAPQKVLLKNGFDFVREYETTPGWINYKQRVRRYELEYSKLFE